MLLCVLHAVTAVPQCTEIIRTLVELLRQITTPGELVKLPARLVERVQWHDHPVDSVKHVLQQMLKQPSPEQCPN